MITITLIGDQALIARLQAMPNFVRDGLARALKRLQLDFIREVVSGKLSGQALKRRTGSLASSVNLGGGVSRFDQSATAMTAIVGTNIKYAHIHEYGGVIPAHEVLPKSARVLAFPWKGEQRFFKRVQIPAIHMPERSFLRSTLREMEPAIRAGMEEAVRQSFAEGRG